MLKYFCFLLFLTSIVRADVAAKSLYEISVKTLEGNTVPMSAFRGRVLMIVNFSSKDGQVSQMAKLEEIYQKYQERGFVVLAFPCDDFISEDPATNAELRAHYSEKFQITFPILEKTQVTGSKISPLFSFLTNSRTDPTFGWEIEWNFTKFLISRSGEVINRFGTTIDPTGPKVTGAIEQALAEKA